MKSFNPTIMKSLLIFTISTTLFSVFSIITLRYQWVKHLANKHGNPVDLDLVQFNNYLIKFNKSYDDKEFHFRLQNFKVSLAEIARLNAVEGATVFGLTKFSDMSVKEFTRGMLKDRQCNAFNRTCRGNAKIKNDLDYYVPPKHDWREHGCRTPVQDQKRCAGCWAFSIIGVMECMATRRGISKDSLSIQELLDCVGFNNNGCSFGRVSSALKYMCKENMNVTTEEEYPLTLKRKEPNSCKTDLQHHGISLNEYRYQCRMDENEMVRQIAYLGPLVAVINGAPLHNYIGGIVRRACVRNKFSAYHAIQIVGYDKTGPIPYYILKNSRGEDFGEDGYVKLAIYGNVCGVREEIAYLDVKK